MNPQRVVLVSPGWPPSSFANGIVSYVENLKVGLERFGVDVKIAAFQTGPGAADARDITGAYAQSGPVAKLSHRALWKLLPSAASHVVPIADLALSFKRLEREWPFDLVEIEETFGLASTLNVSLRKPVIVRLHGPWFVNGPVRGAREDAAFAARVRRERHAIASAAAVSAPSKDVLERTRRYYGLELPDAVVIANPGPEPDAASAWSLEKAERGHVVFVGRFDRHKGADFMVNAFVRVALNVPEARLSLAGPDDGVVDDTGRRLMFQEYVKTHVPEAIRPRITHLGRLDHAQLRELRQSAAVVVCASRYETFSIALVEAFSQGCPVVSSDCGGPSEIAEHERNALVFQPGDVPTLASQVEALLTTPELAVRLGQQALADYRARFLPEPIARQTLEFYSHVMDRQRGAARTLPSRLRSYFQSVKA
jgi:glycosyltransferase involved in cell wall biosynthesis